MKWQGEVCKRCSKRNCIGFQVLDSVWDSVIQGRWNVVCPSCFDEEAEIGNIEYIFIDLFPVSWSQW